MDHQIYEELVCQVYAGVAVNKHNFLVMDLDSMFQDILVLP